MGKCIGLATTGTGVDICYILHLMASLLFEKFVVAEDILFFGSRIIRAQREKVFISRVIEIIEHRHGEGFAYLHSALIQLFFR